MRAGEKMLKAAKVNIILVKKVEATNLLEGLKVRKVGTNVTEKVANLLLKSEERNESVIEKLLQIQMSDAGENEKRVRKQYRIARREADKVLPAGWMRNQLRGILKRDAGREWTELKEKNRRKKDHLENRYNPRKEDGRFWGVAVGDTELGDDDEEVKVLAYEVEISKEEEEYLKVPNSMTDFGKLDGEKVKTGIQVMTAKLRMSVRANEEISSQGLETLQGKKEEMESRRVYSEEKNVADFRKKRVNRALE